MTSCSPAVVAEMRSWLADLTFGDLTSGDVLDASVVSNADVVDAVDRLYAGGAAAFLLTSELAEAGPSDGQLLMELGLVLRGCAGPVLEPRLSTMVAHVCHAYCPAAVADVRAEQLETVLACWLNEHAVLRFAQLSPAALDEWAAGAALVFLRAAVCACGLAQGGAR